MRFKAHTISATALCLFLGQANAATLAEIYDLSVTNDPQIGAAEATFMARKEIVTQARAGLLPSIGIGGSHSESQRAVLPNAFGDRFEAHGWQARINQPVFRLDTWFQFQRSKDVRAQAKANFATEQQDLIVRVAESYFSILEAQDRLTASEAARDATKRQLEQVQQRFDVGLVAITDVLEATAAFDSQAVTVIEAEGAQQVSFEPLLRLTGERLEEVASLSPEFPVKYPEPRDEDAWVETALQQNFSLLAAKEGIKAAQKQIQVVRSGHYPSVDASVSYGHNVTGGGDFFGSKVNNKSISLVLNVPLYSGGAVHSRVKQAIFDLEAAQKNLELTQKSVVEQTRIMYTAINTDVGRVEARLKGIESSQSALDATQTGYEVGTRNIVDVLLAQRSLFQAQFEYASAKYKYVLDTFRIKQLAGTLSPEDIIELTRFLDSSTSIKKLSRVN